MRKSFKAVAIREILNSHEQIRIVVPWADTQIYMVARKYKLPYRATLISHGRRWLKRLGKRR